LGGRLHINEHHVFQNVTGVGTESGATYRLIGATTGTQLIVDDPLQPLVFSSHGMFQQLTSGATGDFRHSVIAHITRSPSGEVVVSFERFEASCT
jgi:hypothetical protein